jgi:serine/threonine protein kinase
MNPDFESLIQSMCHPDSQLRGTVKDLLSHQFFSSKTITNAIQQIKALPPKKYGTPTTLSPLMQMASGLSRYQTGYVQGVN